MNLRQCAKCERSVQESEGVKAGQSWYHVGCAANTWIRRHAPESEVRAHRTSEAGRKDK